MQIYLEKQEYLFIMRELVSHQHKFLKDLYLRNKNRERMFYTHKKLKDFPLEITWEEYAAFRKEFEVKHRVL